MSAREEILRRAREAVGPPAPAAEIAPATLPPPQLENPLELFAERASETGARVRAAGPDPGETIREVAAEHGAHALLVPEGVPDAWLDPELEFVVDSAVRPLAKEKVADADGVLTGCLLAIAGTGTVVLVGGAPAQGRRLLTLLPDLHVCVVAPEQVIASVPEAVARLQTTGRAAAVLITGPSATSDIEFTRIEGVHGPRRLEIVLL